MGQRITPDQVKAVKDYDRKCKGLLSQAEIGRLTGVERSGVSRILRGEYDHLELQEQQRMEFGDAGLNGILEKINGNLEKLVAAFSKEGEAA